MKDRETEIEEEEERKRGGWKRENNKSTKRLITIVGSCGSSY